MAALPPAGMASPPYVLTKFERTALEGLRAEQLVRGSAPLVPVDADAPFDAVEVARRELLARRMPLVVVRRMPDGRRLHVRMEDVDLERSMRS
jgi:DNA-directed RNA polymerase subunit K/omega